MTIRDILFVCIVTNMRGLPKLGFAEVLIFVRVYVPAAQSLIWIFTHVLIVTSAR